MEKKERKTIEKKFQRNCNHGFIINTLRWQLYVANEDEQHSCLNLKIFIKNYMSSPVFAHHLPSQTEKWKQRLDQKLLSKKLHAMDQTSSLHKNLKTF